MDASSLKAAWDAAWPVVTTAVATASALDAVLPQPAPGSHWLVPRKIITFIAWNIGNASNGKQPDFLTWVARVLASVQAKVAPGNPSSTEPQQEKPNA